MPKKQALMFDLQIFMDLIARFSTPDMLQWICTGDAYDVSCKHSLKQSNKVLTLAAAEKFLKGHTFKFFKVCERGP